MEGQNHLKVEGEAVGAVCGAEVRVCGLDLDELRLDREGERPADHVLEHHRHLVCAEPGPIWPAGAHVSGWPRMAKACGAALGLSLVLCLEADLAEVRQRRLSTWIGTWWKPG